MTDDRAAGGAAAPWYLWAVGIAALLWNGFGTFLWAGTTFSPDAFVADLSAAHRDYVLGLPAWSSFTWGLGVLGGLGGSVLLLLRNRLAVPAFALSVLGAVINSLVYVTNPPPAGFFNPALTAFIIGFALFLLWFAQAMKRRGII